MNILKSITIEGLWGNSTSTIKIPIDPNFNFLIGQNGTGKTTVINLIAAALAADFERLDKTQFSRILIILKEVNGRKNPSIEIVKKAKTDIPYYDIEYKIKNSSKEDAKVFDLDAAAEEQFFRGVPPRVLRERFFKEQFFDIQQQLKSMVSLSWLSVHRQSAEQRNEDNRRYISSVDQKLEGLKNEFVKYFAQLSRKYGDQTREFQKKVFLSLLTPQNESSIIEKSKSINIESEKKSLANVFEVLGVESSKYSSGLKTHFEQFQKARESILRERKLTTNSFSAIYNTYKTHSLVGYYEELEKSKNEIFRPRDTFISVLNTLLDGRKIASISERNEITIKAKDGRQIDLEDLSSGEKQLLIILGEALLQENSYHIYIADEPELSLHVTWQEKLTSSISKLNPNAQILFATHSPDIVSVFTDKVINMEQILG